MVHEVANIVRETHSESVGSLEGHTSLKVDGDRRRDPDFQE